MPLGHNYLTCLYRQGNEKTLKGGHI